MTCTPPTPRLHQTRGSLINSCNPIVGAGPSACPWQKMRTDFRKRAITFSLIRATRFENGRFSLKDRHRFLARGGFLVLASCNAIAAGAAEILHKPTSLKALEEVMRRYLCPPPQTVSLTSALGGRVSKSQIARFQTERIDLAEYHAEHRSVAPSSRSVRL